MHCCFRLTWTPWTRSAAAQSNHHSWRPKQTQTLLIDSYRVHRLMVLRNTCKHEAVCCSSRVKHTDNRRPHILPSTWFSSAHEFKHILICSKKISEKKYHNLLAPEPLYYLAKISQFRSSLLHTIKLTTSSQHHSLITVSVHTSQLLIRKWKLPRTGVRITCVIIRKK